MRIMAIIALAAVGFWNPVLAQSTSTDCMAFGQNMVNCDSTNGPDGNAILGTAIGNLITGNSDQHVRSRVGKFLAAGDCNGALQYALKKGRFDLVNQVRHLCAAPAR